MKRFYKDVEIVQGNEGLFMLGLDGKTVQTPGRQVLTVRALALAEAVAAEWRGQGDVVVPETMPLSQLAMSLIDRVSPNRVALSMEVLDYLDTDLLCYRAREPEMYRLAQEAKWDPILTRVSDLFDVRIPVTEGLNVVKQSDELRRKISDFVTGLDDGHFMALYLVTLGTGSLLMAVAFIAGFLSEQEVVAAAFVEEKLKDEIYLGDIYGSAPDQEKRVRALSMELSALSRYMGLTKEQK